jgi:hypothetical protein
MKERRGKRRHDKVNSRGAICAPDFLDGVSEREKKKQLQCVRVVCCAE